MLINKTSAVAVIIHAVSPASIFGSGITVAADSLILPIINNPNKETIYFFIFYTIKNLYLKNKSFKNQILYSIGFFII